MHDKIKENFDCELGHHTRLIYSSTDVQLKKGMDCFCAFLIEPRKNSCLKAEILLIHQSEMNCPSFGFFSLQRRQYHIFNKNQYYFINLLNYVIVLIFIKTEHRN